ncbi:hypothetical protein ACFLY2_02245 [Patescibacteria group bacterium]
MAEIEPLKTDMDTKKATYATKYAEYLVAKAEYDADQTSFTYWRNRYIEYRDLYTDLYNDRLIYVRKMNLASDNFTIKSDEFPKATDYTVSTYINTSYINKKAPVLALDFTQQ